VKKLPVAKHLSDQEYQLLMQVYANHNRSIGLKERVKYSASEIVKVERNAKEKCLEVHYSNGNWWHYGADGKWW
jgi:hypothetical protein